MPITSGELRARFLSPAMHSYFRKKLPELPSTELNARIDETLKFLVISPYCTGPIPVTKDIDEIWHYWILETKEYAVLCRALGTGEFIHHTSNQYLEYFQEEPAEAEDLLLGVRMLAIYVENYGPFMKDRTKYWLLADHLCSKRGWSVEELNEWLMSCRPSALATTDGNHRAPIESPTTLVA
jgi:hypothetical protein